MMASRLAAARESSRSVIRFPLPQREPDVYTMSVSSRRSIRIAQWRDRRGPPRFLTDLSPVHATGQKSKRYPQVEGIVAVRAPVHMATWPTVVEGEGDRPRAS